MSGRTYTEADVEALLQQRLDAHIEIADELRQENARLRAALEPLVEFYNEGLKGFTEGWAERKGPGYIIFGWNRATLTVGAFENAKDALLPSSGGPANV